MAPIAYRSYASKELTEKASDKYIELITTDFRGRKPRKILTQFKLSEDDHAVAGYPAGHTEAAPTSGRPILSGSHLIDAVARTANIKMDARQKSNHGQLYSSFLSVH